jgi:hypothetical protein
MNQNKRYRPTNFSADAPVKNVTEMRLVASELEHAEGETDRHSFCIMYPLVHEVQVTHNPV